MIPVGYFFVLSGLLFFIGVFGFVTRRNLVAMLISVELVLNSVDINFAASTVYFSLMDMRVCSLHSSLSV